MKNTAQPAAQVNSMPQVPKKGFPTWAKALIGTCCGGIVVIGILMGLLIYIGVKELEKVTDVKNASNEMITAANSVTSNLNVDKEVDELLAASTAKKVKSVLSAIKTKTDNASTGLKDFDQKSESFNSALARMSAGSVKSKGQSVYNSSKKFSAAGKKLVDARLEVLEGFDDLVKCETKKECDAANEAIESSGADEVEAQKEFSDASIDFTKKYNDLVAELNEA